MPQNAENLSGRVAERVKRIQELMQRISQLLQYRGREEFREALEPLGSMLREIEDVQSLLPAHSREYAKHTDILILARQAAIALRDKLQQATSLNPELESLEAALSTKVESLVKMNHPTEDS